jgi:hypothetical protein
MYSIPRAVLSGPKKSITDFFIPPPNTGPRVPAPDRNALAVLKAPGSTSTPGVPARNRGQRWPIPAFGNLRSAGTRNIPPWMCIPGTSFRVVGYALAIHISFDVVSLHIILEVCKFHCY